MTFSTSNALLHCKPAVAIHDESHMLGNRASLQDAFAHSLQPCPLLPLRKPRHAVCETVQVKAINGAIFRSDTNIVLDATLCDCVPYPDDHHLKMIIIIIIIKICFSLQSSTKCKHKTAVQ